MKSNEDVRIPRRQRSMVTGLVLVGFLMTVAGCGLTMRVPDVKLLRSRTVLVAPTITAYDLDIGGQHLNEEQQTEALERSIGPELERQALAKGVLPLSFDKVRASGDQCVSLLSTTIRWGARAAMEIAKADGGTNPSGRSSVGQWQSGRDLRPLQHALNAEFALVLYVRDVHLTRALRLLRSLRGLLAAAMSTEDEFQRVFAVCALELSSGRMVWCSTRTDRMVDQYLDLTSAKDVRPLLEDLLARL